MLKTYLSDFAEQKNPLELRLFCARISIKMSAEIEPVTPAQSPEIISTFDRVLNYKLSRKDLLKLAPLAIFGLGVGGIVLEKAGEAYVEQLFDWQTAGLPNAEFLATLGDRIKGLTIDCSFSPEQLENVSSGSVKPVDAIRFLRQDLGMRDFRLGVRWDRVVTKNNQNQINLDYYDDTLGECLTGNSIVTLDRGPVKVFRWPEVHIPDFVLEGLRPKPPEGAQIQPGTDIAKKSLEYTQRLYEALRNYYSPSELSHITTIQTNNEGRDAFGELKWTIHPQLESENVDLALWYFPNANILMNCGNILNQWDVTNFLVELKQQGKVKGKVIAGVDYYSRNSNLPAGGILDSIGLAETMVIFNPLEMNRQSDVDEVECTEGQLEPWNEKPAPGQEALARPGNSVREARYLLLRTINHILRTKGPKRLRWWGAERLAYLALTGQLTNEQNQIVDLTQRVNFQQAA